VFAIVENVYRTKMGGEKKEDTSKMKLSVAIIPSLALPRKIGTLWMSLLID